MPRDAMALRRRRPLSPCRQGRARPHLDARSPAPRVADNPDVLAAEGPQLNAPLAIVLRPYAHRRPVDGVIAQRTVQVGQQVAAGTPLMAVVPLNNVWVDANFKEGQLEDMRVGQSVTVTADIYGGSVTYHGHIEGLGAGSGSAFALLPPQNASGNWIKIVQRVPVRIALDPQELKDHPLRVGLSVADNVNDVGDTSGPLITYADRRRWRHARLIPAKIAAPPPPMP